MADSTNFNHTAPGVYTQVVDQSFLQPQTSIFSCGLVGVAEKGPFNTPVSIASIKQYQTIFGGTITGSYLAQAVAVTSAQSDGCIVARVGRMFTTVAISEAIGSGTGNSYVLASPVSNLFTVGNYVRVRQPGFPTLIGTVSAINSSGNPAAPVSISVVSLNGVQPLYSGASIDQCPVPNAANAAEGFAVAYAYGTALAGLTVSGTRSAFQFVLSAAPAAGALPLNALIRLSQAGLATTSEARVNSVSLPDSTGKVTVTLVTTSTAEQGYQPVPLQDTYTAAQIFVATGATFPVAQFYAATAGTWANSNGSTTGLIVQVGPGTAANSKCLYVYQDSALVETIDNLDFINTASANFAETVINGVSNYLQVTVLNGLYGNVDFSIGAAQPVEVPANTLSGWGTASPVNLCAFENGYNGENVLDTDFIGTVDPSTDTGTGMQVFADTENISIDFLVCVGRTETSVQQEGAAFALTILAQFLGDVPDMLTLTQAIDWSNGVGSFVGQGQLNTYSASLFWNWFSIIDPFSGNTMFVPPTVGALRCLAYTFETYAPWYAAAGEHRGLIPEAVSLRYPFVGQTARDASYGNGQCINPIVSQNGQIMLYGDRTTQRADSKLSALHSVTLTNYMMYNLTIIGRQFVFDPNDTILLSQLYAAYDAFLKGILNNRGLEAYALNVSATAAQRNAREVEVDLAFIPIDVVERILVNATVNSSGATLNSINAGTGSTVGATS